MVFISFPTAQELLRKGLTEGAAKLRAAIWLEETTGSVADRKAGRCDRAQVGLGREPAHTRETLASGLKQASAVLRMEPGDPGGWNLPAIAMLRRHQRGHAAKDIDARPS